MRAGTVLALAMLVGCATKPAPAPVPPAPDPPASTATTTLTWHEEIPVTKFLIFRGKVCGTYVQIASTKNLTYTDKPGKGTFCYAVKAVLGNKQSGYSNTYTVTVP